MRLKRCHLKMKLKKYWNWNKCIESEKMIVKKHKYRNLKKKLTVHVVFTLTSFFFHVQLFFQLQLVGTASASEGALEGRGFRATYMSHICLHTLYCWPVTVEIMDDLISAAAAVMKKLAYLWTAHRAGTLRGGPAFTDCFKLTDSGVLQCPPDRRTWEPPQYFW